MSHETQRFIYSGKDIPPYGEPGQVIVKVAAPFYYTSWDSVDHILNNNNGVLDEGEYN